MVYFSPGLPVLRHVNAFDILYHIIFTSTFFALTRNAMDSVCDYKLFPVIYCIGILFGKCASFFWHSIPHHPQIKIQ